MKTHFFAPGHRFSPSTSFSSGILYGFQQNSWSFMHFDVFAKFCECHHCPEIPISNENHNFAKKRAPRISLSGQVEGRTSRRVPAAPVWPTPRAHVRTGRTYMPFGNGLRPPPLTPMYYLHFKQK